MFEKIQKFSFNNNVIYKQAFRPFNKISLNFIEDLREELKKDKKIYQYPELAYLIFWLRKSKIKKIEDDFKDKKWEGFSFTCFILKPTNKFYLLFYLWIVKWQFQYR